MAVPSLSWAVTYRHTENRLTALLAVALNEHRGFRRAFGSLMNRTAELPVAGVQLSKKIPGTDPDIYFGPPERPELVIEAKLETALRQGQFDALRDAKASGLIGEYRLLGPCSSIFRALRKEDLEEANAQRLSWSDVANAAAAFVENTTVNALVEAIQTEELMDFSGLDSDSLRNADGVLSILMDAKRLGDAVHAICRRKGMELRRSEGGSLLFDPGKTGDAHFAWTVGSPSTCYFYIGFGTHYRFYASIWVPKSGTTLDEAPAGWTDDSGYYAKTWALADELGDLTASQQIDHVAGLWTTAFATAFPPTPS